MRTLLTASATAVLGIAAGVAATLALSPAPAYSPVPVPVVLTVTDTTCADAVTRVSTRILTASQYMSDFWRDGHAWSESVETDNLAPLAEQLKLAAECNG